MKTSIKLRPVAAICALSLFVGAQVFTSPSVQADNTDPAAAAKKMVDEAKKQDTNMPPNAAATVQSKTANGLQIVTFDTTQGRVIVNLPDDMRAGDTISGTVIDEPKGQTPEERAKNKSELEGYVVAISPAEQQRAKTPPIVIFDLSKGHGPSGGSSLVTETFSAPTKVNVGLYMIPNQNSRMGTNGRGAALRCINESCSPISQLVFSVPDTPSGTMDTPDPKIIPANSTDIANSRRVVVDAPAEVSGFQIPTLGQQGKPLVIYGPFDGNASNTTLNGAALRSNVQDFEKNTENVSAGFGLLAESQSKAVFSNSDVIGPIQITLKEGNTQTSENYRNVGVNLSAPKTNLLKGEGTTLTVRVEGLQGISEDVPLRLEKSGVVTMEGGDVQTRSIEPNEVQADGSFTMTRTMTGNQAGAFFVTATVVGSDPGVVLAKSLTNAELKALSDGQLEIKLANLRGKLKAEFKRNGKSKKYKRLLKEITRFEKEKEDRRKGK